MHAAAVPASFEQGGAPAFEYEIQPVPMAELDISTPEYDAHLELEVTGTLKVSFPHAVDGATVSAEGLELEASQAVQGLAHGIQIGGIGSEAVTIGDTWGSQYAQSGFQLGGDGAMVFHGQVQVAHQEQTASGELEVEGTLGYNLKVTIVVHPNAEQPDPQPAHDEQSWFEQHRTLTLVGVAVVLIGVGVAVTLATGGTGTAPAEAATWGALGAAGALSPLRRSGRVAGVDDARPGGGRGRRHGSGAVEVAAEDVDDDADRDGDELARQIVEGLVGLVERSGHERLPWVRGHMCDDDP